jgi:uncharacterized protein YraI
MTRLTQPRCTLSLCALVALASSAHAGELAGVIRPTTVRDAPSEAAAPSGQAPAGDTYAVSRKQGEWVEIQYTENKAWVKALDVEVKEAALKQTLANLNVRRGPSTDTAILATLPRGTWVAERGGTGTWRMISFRGQTAWVYGAYLSRSATDPVSKAREGSISASPWDPDANSDSPWNAAAPRELRSEIVSDEEMKARARQKSALQTSSAAGSAAGSGSAGTDGGAPAAGQSAAPSPEQKKGASRGNCTAIFERTTYEGQRNQMKTGTITINGHAYFFRSGGYGRGNLPPGEYRVTPHMWSRTDSSMSVGGVGYSFALSDAFDPRISARRSLLRIHPDGGVPGTEGCIGIVGEAATQRQFLADMRAQLGRSGSFNLTVR